MDLKDALILLGVILIGSGVIYYAFVKALRDVKDEIEQEQLDKCNNEK